MLTVELRQLSHRRRHILGLVVEIDVAGYFDPEELLGLGRLPIASSAIHLVSAFVPTIISNGRGTIIAEAIGCGDLCRC